MTRRGGRLVSLGGVTVQKKKFMIIVTNSGSGDYLYPTLRHAKWNGCTPTDLVFPFFLFFFQAEDGIRHYKVTGVQTCALPIYDSPPCQNPHRRSHSRGSWPNNI